MPKGVYPRPAGFRVQRTYQPKDPADRFFTKVAWADDWYDNGLFKTRCLDWTASTNGIGYGVFWPGGQRGAKAYAHRWLYERWVGPVPDGMELDHLCRRPICCNPEHLEPVSHRENIARGEWGKRWERDRSRTHCPNGHEYTAENTYWRTDGTGRRCRQCKRLGASKTVDTANSILDVLVPTQELDESMGHDVPS